MYNPIKHSIQYRDGFTGGGVHTPSPGPPHSQGLSFAWPDGVQGGAIFMIKQKNMRDNETYIMVMIYHTVSEYHV